MTYGTTHNEDSVVLTVQGELDAMTVTELRETLDGIVAEGHQRVIVDLTELRMIDSSGVGALVSLYNRLRAKGGKLFIRGIKDQPLAIFRLLKLDRILAPEGAVAA